MLIDSHAHLDFDRFSTDLDEVLARAVAVGVTRILTIGTDLASSRRALALATSRPGLFATAGVHPHEAADFSDADRGALLALLTSPGVYAVGEAGLDYYYDHSPRPRQREVFRLQVELAHETALPLVIHIRDAFEDFFEDLKAVGVPPAGGVLHCFTGGEAEAERALALGLHLSFSGLLTFKTATTLQAAAAITPDDRLLVETDSPYLAPIPHRGKRNEPAFVVETAKALAALKGQSLEEVASYTRQNTERLFKLPAQGHLEG